MDQVEGRNRVEGVEWSGRGLVSYSLTFCQQLWSYWDIKKAGVTGIMNKDLFSLGSMREGVTGIVHK